MSATTRAARAAEQSDPDHNPQFRRGWTLPPDPPAIGPELPSDPAHGCAWAAGELGERVESIQRQRPGWRAAQAGWARLTGHDGRQGLHARARA